MTYAKLPSGTVVNLDGVILARRMWPDEIPDGHDGGYLLFLERGGPLAISAHSEDVESLATFFEAIARYDLTPKGAVQRG